MRLGRCRWKDRKDWKDGLDAGRLQYGRMGRLPPVGPRGTLRGDHRLVRLIGLIGLIGLVRLVGLVHLGGRPASGRRLGLLAVRRADRAEVRVVAVVLGRRQRKRQRHRKRPVQTGNGVHRSGEADLCAGRVSSLKSKTINISLSILQSLQKAQT